MKLLKSVLFLSGFLSLLFLTNCIADEDDVEVLACNSGTFKVISRDNPGAFFDKRLSYFLIEVDEFGEPIPQLNQDVNVTFNYSEALLDGDGQIGNSETFVETFELAQFTDSRIATLIKLNGDFFVFEENGNVLRFRSELISVSIAPANCEDPIIKTSQEVEEDSQDIVDEEACDSSLELGITITDCDPLIVSWSAENEAVDLSDATLTIYGQEIDLSIGSSASFARSELDFTSIESGITGGNICETSLTTIGCGFTGILTITEAPEPGDMVTFTVEDSDLEGSADFDLTISTSLNETESVTLSETQSGVFVGTINTELSAVAGTDNDGVLNVENGVVIFVTYDDELDATASNPEPLTETTTVVGAFAPTCFDGIQNGDEEGVDCGGSCSNACATGTPVTYAGNTYFIDFGSYIDFTDFDGTIFFSMVGNEQEPVIFLDILLGTSTSLQSETYSLGDTDFFVGEDSSINLENEVGTEVFFTSGSVDLVVGASSYILSMNLATDAGTLSGTFEIPFE